MSYRSFTQVAILGSANFTPFMQLRAVERRKLVEDLLDISIFTTMSDILKKKISDHKISVGDNNHEIEILEERINGLNDQLNLLRENADKKIKQYESTVSETQDNIDKLLGGVDDKSIYINECNSTITDKDSQNNKLKEALDVEKRLLDSRNKAIKEIEFYEKNDDCPTCKQGLDIEHKKKHIQEKTNKVKEVKEAIVSIDTLIEETKNRVGEITEVQKQIETTQKEIGLLQSEIVSNQKFIQKIQKEIDILEKEQIGNTNVQDKIDNEEESLDVLHKRKETLVEQKHYHDIATTLLRDQGVRQKIIKQYVPVMNRLINKYLAQLEFYVGFELNESFEETIKSRFRDVFKYDNFSQGEKMRIDLSLLFTWRSVAKMKNSVNTNLLILDEVFDSSLDTNGTDDFLKLLNTLTEKTNAFIISHKGDVLYDKFENVIRFEKHKNFSRVAE